MSSRDRSRTRCTSGLRSRLDGVRRKADSRRKASACESTHHPNGSGRYISAQWEADCHPPAPATPGMLSRSGAASAPTGTISGYRNILVGRGNVTVARFHGRVVPHLGSPDGHTCVRSDSGSSSAIRPFRFYSIPSISYLCWSLVGSQVRCLSAWPRALTGS